MEKCIPLTVLSGFSLKEKRKWLKRMDKHNKKWFKVLYVQEDIDLMTRTEDPLLISSFLGEVNHDREINTISDLYLLLDEIKKKECIDEIVLDIYPFSDALLINELTYEKKMHVNWLLKSHIHIIDASEFWFAYFSEHELHVQHSNNNVTTYTFGEALIKQLEMADVILIGNSEMITSERLGELLSFVRALQPGAQIEMIDEFVISKEKKTAFEQKAVSSLFTDQIEYSERSKGLDVIGQYGIESFVYRNDSLIDFSRLEHFFSEFPNEVFRMKAKCYHPAKQEFYIISQVAASIQVDTFELTAESHSSGVLSEFLFIGVDVNKEAIQEKLQACFEFYQSSFG
jgi:G3E family GTPase